MTPTRTPTLSRFAKAVMPLSVAAALLVGGCVSELPTDNPDRDDDTDPTPEPEPEPEPDPPTPVTGTVMNWADGLPVPDTALEASAISFTGVAGADGTFETPPVDAGTLVGFETSLSGYRPTVNSMFMNAVDLGSVPTYIMAAGEGLRQVTAVGDDLVVGSSLVVIDLLKGDGTPKEGVLLNEVSLIDDNGIEVGDGPYVVGLENLADPDPNESTIIDGRARIIFLNVPSDDLTLSALYPDENGGEPQEKTALLETEPDGAVLLRLNDSSIGGGGGGGNGGGNGP